MEEKEITPEQSLHIIEKMLADTRHKFYNNGFSFLFWGVWIIVVVLADYYIDSYLHKNYSEYIWLISTLIGVGFTIVYYAIFAPKKRIFSNLDTINGKLWMGFMIAFLALMFVCIRYKADVPPFLYCLIGLSLFTSGGIYKFWSLYAGAFVFWIGAILWTFFKTDFELTFLTVLVMFLGYLVPGYLLWRKAKKEANV